MTTPEQPFRGDAARGPLVWGVVRVPPGVHPPAHPAAIRVRLLDVSRADVEAEIVAETVIRGEAPGALGDGVQFALHAGPVNPAASYAVAAHVETREEGSVQPGDYLSAESYPVLTHGAPRHVTVEVHPV